MDIGLGPGVHQRRGVLADDLPSPYQCGVWVLFGEECWLAYLREGATTDFGAWFRRRVVFLCELNKWTSCSELIAAKRQNYKQLLVQYRARATP